MRTLAVLFRVFLYFVLFRTLHGLLWPYRGILAVAIGLNLLLNWVSLAPAQFVQVCLDHIAEASKSYALHTTFAHKAALWQGLKDTVGTQILILLAWFVAKSILTTVTRGIIALVGRHAEYTYRNAMYAHLQKLPLSFYHNHAVGGLMENFNMDLVHVAMYFSPGLIFGINLVTLLAILLPAMLKIHVGLTVAVLVFPLLAIAVAILCAERLTSYNHRMRETLGQLTSYVRETLRGIRTTRGALVEEARYTGFCSQVRHYGDWVLRYHRWDTLVSTLAPLATGLGYVAVLCVGMYEVQKGRMGPGTVGKFLMYAQMMAWPTSSSIWCVSLLYKALVSHGRIQQIFAQKPAVCTGTLRHVEIQGNLRLQDVYFSYPGMGMQVLSGVSVEVAANTTLAIMGTVGSGKSTLGQLIARLYAPNKGTILLDEKPLSSYAVDVLHKHIAYVSQEAFFWQGTLRENLTYGIGELQEQELQEALHTVMLEDFVQGLPQGLDTQLNEQGINLSGGQKQRLALARAMLRKPKIWILDDSLSALDNQTSYQLMGRMRPFLQGRTTIMITHKAHLAEQAHQVAVVARGKLVEVGTPQELLTHKGYFAKLCEQQAQLWQD